MTQYLQNLGEGGYDPLGLGTAAYRNVGEEPNNVPDMVIINALLAGLGGGGGGSPLSINFTIIEATGNFTFSETTTFAYVVIQAAGAGGSWGRYAAPPAYGGGAGAQVRALTPVTPGSTISVTVGQGGHPANDTTESVAGAGGNSMFAGIVAGGGLGVPRMGANSPKEKNIAASNTDKYNRLKHLYDHRDYGPLILDELDNILNPFDYGGALVNTGTAIMVSWDNGGDPFLMTPGSDWRNGGIPPEPFISYGGNPFSHATNRSAAPYGGGGAAGLLDDPHRIGLHGGDGRILVVEIG